MSSRTLRTVLGLTVLAALLIGGLWPATAQDGPGAMGSEGMGASADYKAGEILVKFRAGISTLSANALLDQVDARHVRTLEGVGVEVWQVPEGQELAMAERLSADPAVEFAEPNYRYYAFETGSTPNDTYYYRQWAHTVVNSPAAWDVTTGSTGVVIAIIDSGVDLGHPDLAGKLVAGYDFVGGDASPWDENGHGTHVAGIAAAMGNNGLGVAGMDWQARIMPVRVLDATGAGYSADIVDGIQWAHNHGAKVLNLSLGGPSYSQAMQNAVTAAHDAGRLVVAAIGNCRTYSSSVCPVTNPTNYPAACANVMAVAATGPTDVYAFYSQYGSHCDISAPGGSMSYLHDPNGIYSTMPTYSVAMNSSGYYQNYDFVHGTSQAAPYVSGLAALIWAQSPTLTPEQVQGVIQNTAVDLGAAGWDPTYGHGRIDAGAALGSVSPPAAPTLSPISNTDGDGSYTVSWGSVLWATSYTLQQSTSSTFAAATTLYTGASIQFAVTGQPAGTIRYYRVRASNANGSSAWSNVQSVATKPAAPVLNPISNASQSDAYTVSWKAATGATQYTLVESNNLACSGATVRYTGSALSYSVTGQPNGTWYYCAQASNAAGDSPLSGSQSTTVLVPAIVVPVLSAISNADGDGNYTVTWSSVATANSYTLEEAKNPYFVDPTVVYSGSGTSHAVTGQPEGRWYYRVRAFSADARSPWSNTQSVSVHSKVYLPFVVRNYVGTVPSSNWVTVMEERFEGAFPATLWQVLDNNDTSFGPQYGEYYWGKRNCLPYAGSYSGWAVGAGLDGSSLSCGSSYPNNASSWMIYGPFSLADAVEAELTYQAWVNVLAPGDDLCHMASVDDPNDAEPDNYYGSCTTALFPQAQWQTRSFDLTNVYILGDLTGRSQVWIALIFESDGADTRSHGAYVDDVLLRKNIGAAASGQSAQSSVPADWEEPAARTLTR